MSARKILVGFLLLGALIIFALATFYIENWQFYLQEGYRLNARFTGALELSVGDEVRIAGVEVGRINRISVDPRQDRPVLVTMWIRQDTPIRQRDLASIRMRSVFGGSYLDIARVDHNAPRLGDGDTLENTRVAMGVTDVLEKSDVLMNEAHIALQDARAALQSLASVSARLERGEGTIGRLLADEEAYHQLHGVLRDAGRALEGIADITDRVRSGDGLAARLVNDGELAERIAGAARDMGRFARVLGELSEDFQQSSLGRLASDDGLYRQLEGALKGLEEALASVTHGQGTVGRLISDPELYDKLNATVDGVQEIINEYREQSPILTFTGAIFGAF